MSLAFCHPFFEPGALIGRRLDHHLSNATTPNKSRHLQLDIEDLPDAFLVFADLPGIGEEDVKLEVHKGILSISAEKKVEKQAEGKDGKPVSPLAGTETGPHRRGRTASSS